MGHCAYLRANPTRNSICIQAYELLPSIGTLLLSIMHVVLHRLVRFRIVEHPVESLRVETVSISVLAAVASFTSSG